MENPNKVVLIVEDEPLLQESLSEQLGDLGCTIVTAKDGDEAFQKALSTKPCLILLDILLPKMDGLEMLEKLREEEWGRDISVIVLTNVDPNDEIINKIKVLGVSYYFIKSNVSPLKLKSTVSEMLQNVQS